MTFPLARVTLPDGQTLDAEVLGRTRDTDGTWWYSLRVTLPGPTPILFRAQHPDVQPISGQSYASLTGDTPGPEPEGFLVTHLQRAAGPMPLLHRPHGCWLDLAGAEPVNAERAAELLRDGAQLCDVCMPDL